MFSDLTGAFLQLDSTLPGWLIEDLSTNISPDLLNDLLLVSQLSENGQTQPLQDRAYQLLQTCEEPEQLGPAFRFFLSQGLDPFTLTDYAAAPQVLLAAIDQPLGLTFDIIQKCVDTINALVVTRNIPGTFLLQYPTYLYNTDPDIVVSQLISQSESLELFIHQSLMYNVFIRSSDTALQTLEKKLADPTWEVGRELISMGIGVYVSARLGRSTDQTVEAYEKFKRNVPPQALNNWTHFTKFLAGSLYLIDPSFCQILGLVRKEAETRPYYPYPTMLSGVVLTTWEQIISALNHTRELGALLRILTDSFHASGFENLTLPDLLNVLDRYPDMQSSVLTQVPPDRITPVLGKTNSLDLEKVLSNVPPSWYKETLDPLQKALFLATLLNSDWDDFSAILPKLAFLTPRILDFDPSFLTVEAYLGLLQLMTSETSVVNYEQQQDVHAKLCQILPEDPVKGRKFINLLESLAPSENATSYTISDVLRLCDSLS